MKFPVLFIMVATAEYQEAYGELVHGILLLLECQIWPPFCGSPIRQLFSVYFLVTK